MKYTLRALLAVGLLVGFYVVGLAIVVAIGYAAYLLTVAGASSIAGHFWILVVFVAIAIGRASSPGGSAPTRTQEVSSSTRPSSRSSGAR